MPNPNISPNTGGQIPLAQAIQWTTNFRTANPGKVKAHFFGSIIINDILAQPNCIGIRMYNALDDTNNPQIILVGVDANGDDMTSGIVADLSEPCPIACGNNTALSQ